MKISRLAVSISLLLACSAPAISAQPAGPTAEYKMVDEHTTKSPDGATTIEQYYKSDKDENWIWQFWARRADTMTLLVPEQPDYPAGFSFTSDSRWVIRLQKTGSGESDMFLYRLGPQGFVAATKKPLSELAWNYFYKQPASRKIMKPDFHINAFPLKPTDDKDRSLWEDWPDSRYLVISLVGEVEPTHKHHQLTTVDDWRCRYDLEKGTFDVPQVLRKHNAEALIPARP